MHSPAPGLKIVLMAANNKDFKKQKKGPAPDWVELDIKSGNLKHIYVLYGEETYLRDSSFKRLSERLMPENAEMNLISFNGEGHGNQDLAKEIASAISTMPFLAEHRLICVKYTGWFKNGNAIMEEALEHIPDTTFIIFVENTVDKRKAVCKKAEDSGRLVEYTQLDEEGLKRIILTILIKNNKKIRPSTYEYLLSKTGISMTIIRSELEKLICYTDGRDEITIEDVDAIVSARPEDNVFPLVNALSERDKQSALKAYYNLLNNHTSMYSIISLLTSQFNVLLIVKDMAAKGATEEEIAAKLKYKPYAAKMRMKAASRFSKKELVSFIDDTIKVQEKVRFGIMDENLALERLIVKYSMRLRAEL